VRERELEKERERERLNKRVKERERTSAINSYQSGMQKSFDKRDFGLIPEVVRKWTLCLQEPQRSQSVK
jgi:hypothetical protein